MTKRLEVEMDSSLKEKIAVYAKKNGLRLPFAYGQLLKYGLTKKLEEEQQQGE
jgi:hypothetical protein